ncbi:acetylxylan esterase [Rhizobium sp. SSA_523]|uniref:acetylxylan esterase n=1 Tax=Rhizobium sp. SSA_523 TaxID=2952477 RepID=UPI002090AD12|nr:acetylxylan esterase [Rhizobium sp. SSA_523]MCO5730464.1 acetylxylan esterase [Rhizobium sp. SSA_523]WKC25505.1 acetylxylan esterase [Rhizobium sp. SSA_523]
MPIPADHPFDFDPSYGMAQADLEALTAPEAPPGFDPFWQERYRRALAVDPQPVRRPSSLSDPRWLVEEVRFTSTDEVQIEGWLLTPKQGPVRRGIVVGHGYGGREAPDFDYPVSDAALFFLCFRGLGKSRHPRISADPLWHVLHSIDDPSRYVIGGCVEDLWLAVTTLGALLPDVRDRIGYSGISFGGGIGALAIPFDPRIDRGFLEVPTFGNRPLWLTLPTTGSAAAVQVYRKRHPEVDEALRLYDAATAAARIAVPMLTAVALFDPAVAPPCQFSIANTLSSSRFNQTFILDAGHFDYPGSASQQNRLAKTVRQFFGAP